MTNSKMTRRSRSDTYAVHEASHQNNTQRSRVEPHALHEANHTLGGIYNY